MKKLLLCGLFAFMVVSCGGGEEAKQDVITDTQQEVTPDVQDVSEVTPDVKDGIDIIKPDTTDSAESKEDLSKPDTADQEECIPDCNNKVCGDDNCGGVCGKCPQNTECSSDQSKCIPIVVTKEFGEVCGLTEECRPYKIDPNTGEQVKNEAWPGCADDQCIDQVCFGAYLPLLPFCSKPCAIYTDDVNNTTGESIPDGIEDLNATDSDCVGASETSPFGTEYHCIRYPNPYEGDYAFCYPGHDFKPCKSNDDCPSDEACHVLRVNGEYEWRCLKKMPDSVGIAEECNDDPLEGELKYCSTSLCFGVGCVGICENDSKCLSVAKDKGCDTEKKTCIEDPAVSCESDVDCSAWICEKDFDFFGDDTFLVDLCFPRVCQLNKDCKDSDFYCRLYINSEKDPEKIKWEARCLHKTAGGSKLGEECNANADDTIPDKPCEDEFWCFGGNCLGMCLSENDCAADKDQKCSVVEYGIDADDPPDDLYDTVLPLGVCWYLPGSQKECTLNKDCTETGEVCMNWEKEVVVGEEKMYKMMTTCTTVDEKAGKWGDLCGADTGVTCDIGICLGDDPAANEAGFCTQLCTTKDDCPQPINIGEYTYKAVCRSYLFAWGGTLKDYTDDLYIPLCILMSDEDSLENCEETKTCTKETETCVFWIIATNPDAPSKAEYTCVSNLDKNGQPPPKKYGEECLLEGETVECENLYCEPDAVKDKGYCSKLCNSDDDCKSMDKGFCDSVTVIDRKKDEFDLNIKICRKKIACIPCVADSECPADYICINAGGSGMLADYRCAPPCTINEDCIGKDAGASCLESKDKNGQLEGKLACIPDKC